MAEDDIEAERAVMALCPSGTGSAHFLWLQRLTHHDESVFLY